MSWSFAGAAPAAGGQANAGTELESIETEVLGFQALSGERKVKLLPQQWPVDALPSKTSSLLSVASQRGLLAAAGPDSLLIYGTNDVRSAFARDGSDNIDDLAAKHQTSIPRVSHLAFTSDEQALVITAEDGGGLAIYDVNQLSTNFQPSIQIATNGVAVRHLLPNPNKDTAHLIAVVLVDGKLVLADLKSQSLVNGSSGSILRENVSSASWSRLGRQIVAGLADGSAVQLDTQGNQKEQIPRPPNTDDTLPVVAIYWLENLCFLLVHAPVTTPAGDDAMLAADSIYHIAHRDKDTKTCSFHRFSVDPCPPFNEERLPAHHFIQRIREWQPSLDDSILIACSASTDIGAFTRSTVPLSSDPAITHTYTTTSFTDTRRAALPMAADGLTDTFPIGVALDLSSQQKVTKPIPNDETLDESPGPLPQYCVLNQEGNLSAWWYIYNEAVRTNTPAPGLRATASDAATQSQAPKIDTKPAPTMPFGQQSTPAFGQSSFGQASKPAFGQSSFATQNAALTPAFAAASTAPANSSPFAQQTSAPAFGAPSTPTQNASPFTGAAASGSSAFDRPAFGATSQLGASTGSSAFGQAGGLAFNKTSPWGGSGPQKSAFGQSSSFGQPSFGQPSLAASPFANHAGGQDDKKPAASPFAAFAKSAQDEKSTASPFAAFAKPAQNEKTAASPFAAFAQKSAASPFASFSTQGEKLSPFAGGGKPGMPNETSFGSTVTLSSNNTSSFNSGATFGQPSPFGKPEVKEENMSDVEIPREKKQETSTLGGLSGFKLGSTFKQDSTSRDNEKAEDKNAKSSLFGFGFGNALNTAVTEKPAIVKEEPDESAGPSLKDIPVWGAKPTPSKEPEAAPLTSDFLVSKPEDKEQKRATEAPLPPDVLKPSPKDDAPLPPDFLSKTAKTTVSAEEAPLPPDFLSKPAPKTEAELPPSPDGSDDGLAEEADSEIDADAEVDEADLPEDDDSAEWEEEDDEEDGAEQDEDDEDDDEEDEEDEDQSPVIANPGKLSAFEARITPASPKKIAALGESTTPETVQRPSFTPAGFPVAPLSFVPTRKVEESPRSPSPVRAVTSPVRFDQYRPTAIARQDAVPPIQAQGRASMRSSMFQAPPPPKTEDLEDDDDLRMQQILTAPIEPSKQLPAFVAHQDYAGVSRKEGIAGQLERVYRDVNSMLDTLGLNARALQSFVAGHEQKRTQAVEEDDLDDPDSWVLVELSSLDDLQTTIDDRLEQGKVVDVQTKIDDIHEQQVELGRTQALAADLRKQVSARSDPEKRAQQQSAPLSQAWSTQQLELRQSVQQVQKLLAQVENNIALLKADLASAAAASPDGSTTGVPTVEAVTNTILKMTGMIERKSGDVDVLEAQIRRLPDGMASLGMLANYEANLADSLAGSRISNGDNTYATPRKAKGKTNGEALGMSGMFGSRFQTPPSASLRGSMIFDPTASALGRSTSSLPGSARKKMADVTNDDVEAWKAKTSRRSKVLGALRNAVEGAGDARIKRVE